MKRGYTHIYTGNGKGKTTAAFGLALRAACSGKKIFIGQFVKNMKYNETKIVKIMGNIDIKQFGSGCFIDREPSKKDIDFAEKGFDSCLNIIASEKYDMIILDELTIALYFNLINEARVIKLIQDKPIELELIITGRYASDNLIFESDLVTEMRCVKHYYESGVLARDGIER